MSGCGSVTTTIELASQSPIRKSDSVVKPHTDLQECVARTSTSIDLGILSRKAGLQVYLENIGLIAKRVASTGKTIIDSASPQSFGWIDSRCPSRREIAGEQGDTEKRKRRENKSRGVSRANVVQNARQQSGQEQCGNQAKGNSCRRELQSLTHDHSQKVCAFRT